MLVAHKTTDAHHGAGPFSLPHVGNDKDACSFAAPPFLTLEAPACTSQDKVHLLFFSHTTEYRAGQRSEEAFMILVRI